MIVLNDTKIEIGIYPGRCIEAKNLKKGTERTIKWSEVKKSPVLRHLTETLISRLKYDLNGFSSLVFDFIQIEKEDRKEAKQEPIETPPVLNVKPTPKMFLKAAEVAELYGLNTSTLANWRHKRIGPKYHKVGGAVRYKVEDLNEFMKSRRIKTE